MLTDQQRDSSPGETLAYEPVFVVQRRRQKLRRLIRIVFAIAVGSVAIATAWRFGKQFHYLWLQHQCMTHVMPPGPMSVASGGGVTNAAPWPPGARIAMSSDLQWCYPLFIHERRTPLGASRLVIVAEFAIPGGFSAQRWMCAFSYEPAGIRPGSRLAGSKPSSLHHNAGRFYGGRIDPSDESHFTIDYETPQGNGTIDGWVHDDGRVTLEVRDGPFKSQ